MVARRSAAFALRAGLLVGAATACGPTGRGETAPASQVRARWEYANLTVEYVPASNRLPPIIWTAPDTTFSADTFREFAAHFPDVRPPAHLDGDALALNVAGARGWELTACYAYALSGAGIVTECYFKRARPADENAPPPRAAAP